MLVAVLVAGGAPGVGGTGPAGAAAGTGMAVRSPTWVTCPTRPAYQCATVDVPLDYDRPGRRAVALAVIRVPPDAGQTSGDLFLNPGGPGESGVQIIEVMRMLLPVAVADHFDLVSFDERGTGESGRLVCGPAPAAVTSVAPVPTRAGQVLPGTGVFSDLARACTRRYGSALAQENTTNAARDMDRIRAALGVSRLSYYGLSYGTVMGARYATLFPGRVRAMVLDGAVDASLSLGQQAAEEAPAIEASLEHFLATCGGTDPCPLGPDPRAPSTTRWRPASPGGPCRRRAAATTCR